MRINTNTQGALAYINKPRPFNKLSFQEDPTQSFIDYCNSNWNDFRLSTKDNISIISKSFEEALVKNGDKLVPLYSEMGTVKGVFIIDGFYYFFDLKREKNNGITQTINPKLCVMTSGGDIVFLMLNDANYCSIKMMELESKKGRDSIELIAKQIIVNIIFYCLFKQYAQVEEKILEPNNKVRIMGCKYLNETNHKITHLDCTWFTTLIKSDEFKVRGHFRLQPYGEGMKQKRLQWISDFKKEGYTRKAQILSQENN